jgi:hypothetical protein
METWLLTFYLAFPTSFLGGEYYSLDRCEAGARHQLMHWQMFYGPKLRWRCELSSTIKVKTQ